MKHTTRKLIAILLGTILIVFCVLYLTLGKDSLGNNDESVTIKTYTTDDNGDTVIKTKQIGKGDSTELDEIPLEDEGGTDKDGGSKKSPGKDKSKDDGPIELDIVEF